MREAWQGAMKILHAIKPSCGEHEAQGPLQLCDHTLWPCNTRSYLAKYHAALLDTGPFLNKIENAGFNLIKPENGFKVRAPKKLPAPAWSALAIEITPGDLTPRHSSKWRGDRAFSVVASSLWSSLHEEVILILYLFLFIFGCQGETLPRPFNVNLVFIKF